MSSIRLNDGRTRVLRVFDFVEGADPGRGEPGRRAARQGGRDARDESTWRSRTFTHPADRRGLVWDIRHFHQLTELVEHTPSAEHRQLAEKVFQLFGETVVPRLGGLETQVIHGDYSPYNVVVDPQGEHFITGVIDFGDTRAQCGDLRPRRVPWRTCSARTPDHPWQDACAFVAGYERTRPIKDSELPLLPVAALARLTLRALLTNWRAERAPERREYLLGHAKDDWAHTEHALAVSLDDVIAQLR